MLKFLGRRKRSRNALLIVFVGILTLSLVGLFSVIVSGGGTSLFGGSGGAETTIAKVGDYKVTLREMRDTLRMYGQQMAAGQGAVRQEDPAATYRSYGPQVIEGLVRQKLILYQADRLNLNATDREVQERLKQVFNPWPGAEQYRMRLQQAGTTPVRFEDNLRASITEEHLRSYVSAPAQVSPQEVEDEYRRNNTSYNIRWVEVVPDKFRDKVQINDADLRAHFDQNKDEFRINTEQRRARYVFIDQAKAGDAVQISDEELKQDFNPDRNVQQVRVSQIILNIPQQPTASADKNADANANANKSAEPSKAESEDQIRERADNLVTRAKGAEGKPAEDFAALARANSDDPKSRAQGGDIGWVNKKDKRETDDPINRVFGMSQDQVSEPIRKGDKYYILKVTDRKTPTFEESREELLKQARARKGYSKAVEIAAEAQQRLKETKNADAVVSEINSKYGTQLASAKETPFVSQSDSLPDLGQAVDFQSALFRLDSPGDISEHTSVSKGFAIIQYLEKRDPHDATFDEVRAKVEESFRADKAKGLAAEAARQIGQAQSSDALKRAADAMGIRTEERAGLTGNDSIGPLVSEANRLRVYKLNPGEVTREPVQIEGGDSFVVAAMIARKDADMGEPFQKERKAIEDRLLDEKRNAFFQSYVAETQKRLKDEGELEIYQDVIDDAMESEMPLGGQSSPNAPFTPGRPTAPPRRPPTGATPLGQ